VRPFNPEKPEPFQPRTVTQVRFDLPDVAQRRLQFGRDFAGVEKVGASNFSKHLLIAQKVIFKKLDIVFLQPVKIFSKKNDSRADIEIAHRHAPAACRRPGIGAGFSDL
jgi:hypothetical protein